MNATYRFKVWYLLLNIAIVLAALSMLGGAVVTLVLMILLIAFLFQQGMRGALIFPIFFAGVLVVFIPLLIWVGIVLPLGNALCSYLRIGATGLELRIWPGYRLQCAWHQIVGLEHVKIFGGRLSLPVLCFKEGRIESRRRHRMYIRFGHHGPYSETVEYPASFWLLDAFLLWAVDDKNLIPVYIFNGWPNGRLREDLERRLGTISLQ